MNRPGDQAIIGSLPAGDGDPSRGRGGVLEKLMTAVRPEFRRDDLVFDPRDPVLGGPACMASGCLRPARALGLCWGHHQRWVSAGKPDLGSSPRRRIRSGSGTARCCRAMSLTAATAGPGAACAHGTSSNET